MPTADNQPTLLPNRSERCQCAAMAPTTSSSTPSAGVAAGRPDIDAFEAVMEREDRQRGFFVGVRIYQRRGGGSGGVLQADQVHGHGSRHQAHHGAGNPGRAACAEDVRACPGWPGGPRRSVFGRSALRADAFSPFHARCAKRSVDEEDVGAGAPTHQEHGPEDGSAARKTLSPRPGRVTIAA